MRRDPSLFGVVDRRMDGDAGSSAARIEGMTAAAMSSGAPSLDVVFATSLNSKLFAPSSFGVSLRGSFFF